MKDLTGETYGYWLVKKFSHQERAKTLQKGRRTPCLVYFWECICIAPKGDDICGTVRVVASTNLKTNGSTNCGCLHPRFAGHGKSNHPIWRSWHSMRQRCDNPNAEGYELYGGRGITYCKRWNSFEAFWEDMAPTWSEGRSLDRYPDQDGNYGSANCRWATPKEQAGNRSTNRIIQTPEGPMNVTQAAERFGIDARTIFGRIHYGWDEADLLLPVNENRNAKGRFEKAKGRKTG